MKTRYAVMLGLLVVLVVSCSTQEADVSSSSVDAEPSQDNNLPPAEPGQLILELSTTLPDTLVATPPSVPPASRMSSPDTIIFEDNGKTINYHVGDSFLLNLGGEVYEWTVMVEDQNVVALKVGAMVIKGAQGLFDAIGTGATSLTAVGDPLCRKSIPPCGAPTILYKVTLIVE